MKFEFSAGGVVFKKEAGKTLILVAQHSQHHGWVFPKGLIGDHIAGEDKESTALREVKEETGAEGEILAALTPVSFWYVMDNLKRKKTVYYYVMKYVSGDISQHDFEMENVEWLPSEQVMDRLTYQADKDVWQEARKIITKLSL